MMCSYASCSSLSQVLASVWVQDPVVAVGVDVALAVAVAPSRTFCPSDCMGLSRCTCCSRQSQYRSSSPAQIAPQSRSGTHFWARPRPIERRHSTWAGQVPRRSQSMRCGIYGVIGAIVTEASTS
jgi:hypothetical protein